MPSLPINGRVSYADLLPAENIRVKIKDLDLGPGGSNDQIFNKLTITGGKFAGASTEWQDREGVLNTLLGPVNIPDVLNLQFEVIDGAQNHQGAFVRVGNNSLPIILPPNYSKPIEKAARDIIQVVHLVQNDYTPAEKLLYGFIEAGSAAAVSSCLGNDYRQLHLLDGADATLAKLKDKLMEIGNRAGTKAIDLVFCTHGHTSKVVFADGKKRMEDVLDALDDIPQSTRNKFRMVFSTACFGDTHADMWQDAGFACVSGSEGIYADSEASLLPFLQSWESGKSFREAIRIANAADIGNVADNAAKLYYITQGRTADANDINSNRIMSGNGNLRIYSKPR